mgnify:FL=1
MEGTRPWASEEWLSELAKNARFFDIRKACAVAMPEELESFASFLREATPIAAAELHERKKWQLTSSNGERGNGT